MTSCFKNELQGKYEKPISNHCHMITIETFLPLGKSLLALSRQYASLLTLSRWYALWEQRYQFIFRKRKERREENPSKVIRVYIYNACRLYIPTQFMHFNNLNAGMSFKRDLYSSIENNDLRKNTFEFTMKFAYTFTKGKPIFSSGT